MIDEYWENVQFVQLQIQIIVKEKQFGCLAFLPYIFMFSNSVKKYLLIYETNIGRSDQCKCSSYWELNIFLFIIKYPESSVKNLSKYVLS